MIHPLSKTRWAFRICLGGWGISFLRLKRNQYVCIMLRLQGLVRLFQNHLLINANFSTVNLEGVWQRVIVCVFLKTHEWPFGYKCYPN